MTPLEKTTLENIQKYLGRDFAVQYLMDQAKKKFDGVDTVEQLARDIQEVKCTD